ncbi:MAG: hypothetical protein R3B06_01855 [Kofleriaceae bacterium]
MLPAEVDLLVVGAGTAGAATAMFAAARGLRTLCLDRRPLDQAGARWVNGVTRTALAEAGVHLPGATEAPSRFHLVAGAQRVTVDRHDVVDLDMRALVGHLHARATAAGAQLVGEVAVRGRAGGEVTTSAGPVRARWIVDASGLAGAGLLAAPPVAAAHLCAAAQAVYEIADRHGAAAFAAAGGVPWGEVAAEVGVAGGYSVRNVRIDADGATVAVLTGSIPAAGVPSGKAILDEFVRAHRWIGPRVFGGSGAIPLRRPRDVLTDGTVALVGDTGCQVFPAHGSGIGAGLGAARLLVDALAAGGTPFDYELAWHRRWGGLFAAYDAVRRWNQRLTGADVERLMAAGLVDADLARAGLDQVMPTLTPRALVDKAAAARHAPSMLALGARVAAALALGSRCPPRGRRRAAWSAAMQRLLPV